MISNELLLSCFPSKAEIELNYIEALWSLCRKKEFERATLMRDSESAYESGNYGLAADLALQAGYWAHAQAINYFFGD